MEKSENELERTKRWLKRYRKNKALIDRLENKLYDIDDRLYKIKSPSFSGMPKGGTPVTLDEILSEKYELEDRINRLVRKGRKMKVEILDKIDQLDDVRQAEVMEMFFIDCLDFDTIGEKCGYSMRHVVRIYSDALMSITCH